MINYAPHSTLREIMKEYADVERVREIAAAVLAQTDNDVPDLFFSKEKEGEVREGLDEFIEKVAESDQPPNGEIRQQASVLNQRVYEAHHETAAEERALIERNRKSYRPPQSSTTDSM